MPIYSFKCPTCGEFDELLSSAEVKDAFTCPKCERRSKRVITAPMLCFPAHLADVNLVSNRRHAAWMDSPEIRAKRDSGEYRSPTDSLSDLKRAHKETQEKTKKAKLDKFVKKWGALPDVG